MRISVILVLFMFVGVGYAQTLNKDLPKEDASIKMFSYCGQSTGCLLTETIVFAPIFPWFLYPLDDEALPSKLRRYQRFSGMLDFLLIKANDHNSGYKVDAAFYKKWVGFDVTYDTLNNGDFDQSFYAAHVIFRPFPRKHFQPKFLIGWKYITTDVFSGGGLHISFFNYDINFSRRFSMFVVNYLGWVKKYTIVEGVLGFEYFVYPTISLKAAMDLRHIADRSIYGAQMGLSLKL